MKLILIPVSDRPECINALHQGFTLGQALGASVIGCHIRPHRNSAVNLPDESNGSIITADSYDLAWEAAIEAKAADDGPIKAMSLFQKIAEQFNYPLSKKPQVEPCALWTEQVGSPDKLFSIMGPMTDLMVVSRPAKKGQSVAKTIMLNAILNAGTPILVLPQDHTTAAFTRVAIAWNQSTEIANAIKSVMPLIAQAKQVNIITNQAERKLGPKVKQLQSYLTHWGIENTHVKAEGKNDYAAIMNGYHASESELLVMGGYSHSRLRQRVFGGVTENMLNDAKIPVLIMHT